MNPQTTAPASSTPTVQGTPNVSTTPSIGVQQPTAFNPQAAMDAIAQYYKIPTASAGAVGEAKAGAYNAQTSFENSIAQKQLQIQRAQDKIDPSKYKIIQGQNGVHILDPMGNEVTVGQYANTTGASPADALKNSTNPQDQQFVADYNNFQSFINAAMQRGTSKEAAQVYQGYIDANPSLANLTPQQASSQFLSQYGSYFGMPQNQQTPTTGQFTPQYSPSIENYVAEKGLFGQGPAAMGTNLTALRPTSLSSQAG